MRLRKDAFSVFGLGLLVFFGRIFYGIYHMAYLCNIRMNHYGKVCSGDYIKEKNLSGYEETQE
jgi:hypothetical protein